jgi:hypothetical protein
VRERAVSWSKARYAERANHAAMLVCCGGTTCFDGRGCNTARWWTFQMEEAGYRLARKPHVVGGSDAPEPEGAPE